MADAEAQALQPAPIGDYEDELKGTVQARIEAQLDMLEARPQILNDYLEVVAYDGGTAGIGYEVENVLEFSRAPLHRSGPGGINATLILKCRTPLLLDYVRVGTSTHLNFALRAGVVWLYTTSHGDPRNAINAKNDPVHPHLFRNCASAADFDRICNDIDALRLRAKRTTKAAAAAAAPAAAAPAASAAGAEFSGGAASASAAAAGEDLAAGAAADAAAAAASGSGGDDDAEVKPGEFPDCFYFDTDPVTYSTTVALRNQSRVADMEKHVVGREFFSLSFFSLFFVSFRCCVFVGVQGGAVCVRGVRA
jgi:hypothetical protein